jgi:hypothetical protein
VRVGCLGLLRCRTHEMSSVAAAAVGRSAGRRAIPGIFPFRDEALVAARADPLVAPKLPSQQSGGGVERATALHVADHKPWPFPPADLDDDRALAMLAWLGRKPFGVPKVLTDAPGTNRVDHHPGATRPVESRCRPVNGLFLGKGTTTKLAIHGLCIAFGTKRAHQFVTPLRSTSCAGSTTNTTAAVDSWSLNCTLGRMPDPSDALSAFAKAWFTVTAALTLFVGALAVSRGWDPVVFEHTARDTLVAFGRSLTSAADAGGGRLIT